MKRRLKLRRRSRTKRKGIKRSFNRRKYLPRASAFKRTFYSFSWSPATTTTGDFWKYIELTASAIPSNGEYAAVFDQYKINGFKYTFRPRYDGFEGSNTTDTTLPGVSNQAGTMLHIINDPTSTTSPSGTYTVATLHTFMENGNVRTYSGNRPVSVYVKPLIYDTVTGGSTSRRPGWIPWSNTAIPHRGFHVFTQDTNMTGVFGQAWDVYVTVYFQCRGMK